MPKRHKHEEHENHERWLVSYADFITLLFAFFVVMYAISEVDAKKAKKVEKSVQFAFHYQGTGGVDRPPIFEGPVSGPLVEPVVTVPPIVALSPREIARHEREELGRVAGEVVASLEALAPYEALEDVVQLGLEERGLVIRLSLDYLFDAGSDTLVPAAQPVVDRVAEILVREPRELRIEGHADNRPIRSLRFPSNWELSAARATGIVRYLVAAHGFAPERLSASGYGEFRPIATNDMAEGRARNRRVDLVVLARRAEIDEPHPADPIAAAEEAAATLD